MSTTHDLWVKRSRTRTVPSRAPAHARGSPVPPQRLPEATRFHKASDSSAATRLAPAASPPGWRQPRGGPPPPRCVPEARLVTQCDVVVQSGECRIGTITTIIYSKRDRKKRRGFFLIIIF